MTDIVYKLTHIARSELNPATARIICEAIDNIETLRALNRSLVAAENEACAKIVDPPKSIALSPEARIAMATRELIAAAIRARMEAKP